MLECVRIAVCGELPTACAELRKEGIKLIEPYSNALDLAASLRKGIPYHLILIHAPLGEGLTDMSYPYKVNLQGDWRSVPVRMLSEPPCRTVLSELKDTVWSIAGGLPSNRCSCGRF